MSVNFRVDDWIIRLVPILLFGLGFAIDIILWVRYLRAPQDARRRRLSDAVWALLIILSALLLAVWATDDHG